MAKIGLLFYNQLWPTPTQVIRRESLLRFIGLLLFSDSGFGPASVAFFPFFHYNNKIELCQNYFDLKNQYETRNNTRENELPVCKVQQILRGTKS